MKSNKFGLLELVIFVGLVLVVFIYNPYDPVIYEIPKVKFLYIWSTIILALSMQRMWKTKRVSALSPLHIIVILWLGLSVIASWIGADWWRSVFGNYYRWDGLITSFSLVSIFFGLSMLNNKTWWIWAERGLIFGNLGSMFWIVCQRLTSTQTGFNGLGAGFGQPVFLAGYLIMTSPFVLWKIVKQDKNGWKKLWFGLYVSLIFFTLWQTKSLFPILFLPVLGAWSIVEMGKLENKWVWITILLFGLIALGMYRLENIMGKSKGGIMYEGRERLIMKSLLSIKSRPIMGWGVANFDKAFDSVDWPIRLQNDVYVDKAHSSILEMFVTGGIIGGITYLFILGYSIKLLIDKQTQDSRILLVIFVTYVLHTQTNVVSIAEELIFWLVLARIESLNKFG